MKSTGAGFGPSRLAKRTLMKFIDPVGFFMLYL